MTAGGPGRYNAARDLWFTSSVRFVGLTLLALLCGSCSTTGTGVSGQSDTATVPSIVILTVPSPTGTVPVVITIASSLPAPATTVGQDDGINPLGGNDPEDKLMPDVLCLGLQAAQDEIQDHGVLLSRSEDASGRGRRQVWDRNWIVVEQRPAAGQPIGEAEAVLFVVKNGEPSPCE